MLQPLVDGQESVAVSVNLRQQAVLPAQPVDQLGLASVDSLGGQQRTDLPAVTRQDLFDLTEDAPLLVVLHDVLAALGIPLDALIDFIDAGDTRFYKTLSELVDSGVLHVVDDDSTLPLIAER